MPTVTPTSSALRAARLAGAALLGTALALGAAPLAHAAQQGPQPDPRAKENPGNETTCAKAGLSGQIIMKGFENPKNEDLVVYHHREGGSEGEILAMTIPDLPDGWTAGEVTGIVVKGGPAWNLYEPGRRGLSEGLPWERLRSPLNKGGKQAAISHWFVCAEEIPGSPSPTPPSPSPTPTSPSPSPTPTSPSPSPTPTSPSPTPTETESDSPSPTPTDTGSPTPTESETPPAGGGDESPKPTPVSDEGDLPFTGASLATIIALALALLGAGVGLTMIPKRRRG